MTCDRPIRHATSHNRNKGNSGRPRVVGYDSHEKQNRKCLELQGGRKLKEQINVTKFKRLVKYSESLLNVRKLNVLN